MRAFPCFHSHTWFQGHRQYRRKSESSDWSRQSFQEFKHTKKPWTPPLKNGASAGLTRMGYYMRQRCRAWFTIELPAQT